MGWHETAVSMLVCLTIVLGLLGAAMSKVLWPSFTLATIIAGGALQAQWSLNRAVITNLVGPDEVRSKGVESRALCLQLHYAVCLFYVHRWEKFIR